MFKNAFEVKNKFSLYKFTKAFSSDWTSNAQTWEVTVRHVRQQFGTNHMSTFSVFNRNRNIKSRAQQAYFKSSSETETKDFPGNSHRLAQLTKSK